MSIIEDDVDVVMFVWWCAGVNYAQATGHAEMQDGRAASGCQQQVFAAA